VSLVQIHPNGSLHIAEAYMEDGGKYGCTAGNSGGLEREEVFLQITSTLDVALVADFWFLYSECTAVVYFAP
jgi:Immunoglobulin I-set domain